MTKKDFFALLGDINGVNKQELFNDPLIRNKHEGFPPPTRGRSRNRRHEHFDDTDNCNDCDTCIAYENIIAFYHKLAFIIIVGLLLKFILDSIVNK